MHLFRLFCISPRGILFLLILCANAFSRIALTELLSDPKGGETQCPGGACLEFIEYTNLGCSPIPLSSLLLTDGATCDSIIAFSQPISWHPDAIFRLDSLACGQSLLILDPDYISVPTAFRLPISGAPVLCTVNHTSLLGGLTNRRAVFLYRGTRSHIDDSLYALVDSGQEISLHQQFSFHNDAATAEGSSRIPQSMLFSGTGWISSPSPSPGFVPMENDRWIIDYRLTRKEATGVLHCMIAIFDSKQDHNQSFWSVVDDAGTPLSAVHPINDCLVHAETDIPLDTAAVRIKISTGSNHVYKDINLSGYILPTHSLCFSEISPRKNGFTEWIELTNVSSVPIDLSHFLIHTPEDSFNVATHSRILQPSGYLILARDAAVFSDRYPLISPVLQPESWVTLDDYDDTLFITHATGQISDSAVYDNDWFTSWSRESLQRIDLREAATAQKSWQLSPEPSPGLPNGNPQWRTARSPTIEIGPSPFTPNGDNRDDKLMISLLLPTGWTADISIYSFDGVKRVEKKGVLENRFLWNGRDDYGKPTPVGPFFVVMRASDGNKTENIIKKGILWR
ncbi:MAG: hypothetical protein ACOCW2_01355 [Chitinivibrionales bacterium]